MRNLTPSLPAAVRPSPRTRAGRETAELCLERASADLLRSATMLTANERSALERSSASWALRAELLGRLDGVAKARTETTSKGLIA
jgi:hypothetical protein